MAGVLERRRLRRRAGASAVREYEQLKKQWRREHRRLFLVLEVVAGAVIVVTMILAWPHVWAWLGGLFAGGALFMVLALREDPPTWIEHYQLGAFGEQRTARAVEPLLARGWIVLHDLSRYISNLDHVIIGPGGVFILDTKNSAGTAEARGDRLRIVRPDGKQSFDSEHMARQARAQGVALHDLIKRRCGVNVWVDAAIVLWAKFPQRAVEGRSMAYVHGDHVVDWLLSRPARLNANQIDQIAAALQPGQRRRTTEPAAS
jgi:hypothetical protein